MKYLKFLLIGVFFGIVLYKSEAVSWYRIYEMFRFESFHMYGIIGSAVGLGVLAIQLIKRNRLKSFDGEAIHIAPKEMGLTRYLLGGCLFGLGWALAGACPGPMYILAGAGYWPILIVLFGAILGTFTYGIVKKHLPH
ncbi:MAG: YeeE/YedE family protein [Saprospiraceae bacterium]|nr:YeeE/YedE family protein [Saprospiraceae bacterium]